ncbi:type III pantothenate kinase [Arcobacter sp. FWKO B]|uniref:type III pantothenate kinase n=1 Tax=Arcobacter sp. FWKO B TaxID=2593672 RepID=UPI0018A35365|nr:type III pantothenate kinase [Arcobacter sp. FWKO B]QOG12901.1 type III pantothenate kinase [Arcobacter sp. FWKO B]
MILCDIGNSTFDFFYDNHTIKLDINTNYLPDFEDDKDVYFISVNEMATHKLKQKYTNAINLAQKIKFETSYTGLGIDRAVVCSYIKDGLIIDAGSAITVDLMENGKHMGGYILPGLKTMHKTYKEISPKLDVPFDMSELIGLPLNTKDAINYGIFHAIFLPLKQSAISIKNVIVTGGDGELISKHISHSKYDKNLIFKAMERIINAHNSLAQR